MTPPPPSLDASASPAPDDTAASDLALESGGRILIVDDVPTNVRLLSVILSIEGYEVVGANSGIEALELLHPPATAQGSTGGDDEPTEPSPDGIDVVLLDVMMPGMDGFETCARIRANPATAKLPIVMVTALHDAPDRIRALEAGADDFLTKPIEENEVLARVRSLVRAKRDRDALEKAYREIKEVEELRHFLTEMLVHDLRTPLTTVLASLNLLETGMVGKLDPIQQEVTTMCSRSGQHLLGLVNQLLDISRLESGEMPLERAHLDARALLEDAIRYVADSTRNAQTDIQIEVAPDLPPAWADEDLLRRVLINLLGNALKFARRKTPILASIATRTGPDGPEMIWSVTDDGEGIAPADQVRIFSKFGQAESRHNSRRTSTGLGLTFCKLAVESQGGRIGVESTPDQGSTFWFSLPLPPGTG